MTFTAGTGLSGADDNFILVQSSEALGSVPTNVYIVSGSCIQSGTAGAGGAGTAILEGVTIELDSGCTIAAGTAVQVYFTADAPSSTGEFYFTVTTSSSALATSNIVAVGTSTGTLAAASYSFGASTTYTISGMLVGAREAGNNTLNLTAVPVAGTEALSFFNGAAGYNVTFAPSGSSAISDPVETATVSGNTVSLHSSPLVAGDILTVTASGPTLRPAPRRRPMP